MNEIEPRARWRAALSTAALSTTLVTAAAVAAPLQPPPAPPFEEEVRVTEVLLDVLVTDRRGNVVVGLGPEDFVVSEDGEPVELTSVTFYSNRELLASPDVIEQLGVPVERVPVDRYFVLLFHDPRAMVPRLTAQLMDAGRWARRWAQGSLLPNDHVAVASYDTRLKVQQDFTTDHGRVVAALEDAVMGRVGSETDRAAGEGSPSLLESLPDDPQLGRRTTTVYAGLEELAEALGGTPGRKNLVLFSIGFGDTDRFGFFTPDPRYYPPMVRSLNANNVAVYAVDLIPTSAVGPMRRYVLNNALATLASDTGGEYHYHFINFLSPLESITEDNSGYYLLSFTAEHRRGASGFQDVRVETRNPQLRVRARQGYRYGPE